MTSKSYETVRDRLLSTVRGRTLQGYKYDLGHFERYCARTGVDPLDADRRLIEAFAQYEYDRGMSVRTVNTKLAHVAGFFEWAFDTGAIATNPAVKLRHARTPRPAPRMWLGPHDLRALLAGARSSGDPVLNSLVHLWALAGLRMSDSLMLNVSDISSYDGRMTIRVTRAKNTCVQNICLTKESASAIQAVVGTRTAGPLFVSRIHRRLTPAIARQRLRKLTDSLNLPPVTPQGLRVGFITLSLKAGVDERTVGISAGHSSTQMTARYDAARDSVESIAGLVLSDWLSSLDYGAVDTPPTRQARGFRRWLKRKG